MKRVIITIGLLVAAGVCFWFFPLLHVVPLRHVQAERQQAEFKAEQFAQEFWAERLMPALDRAADAAAVLAAARKDPQLARDQFGRSVGLGRAVFHFLRGSGVIVSVDSKGVGVSLDGQPGEPDLVLQTGLLFGNAVRDATGLLDPSDFPNSQDFNDISTELNRIVETEVVSTLRQQARVGQQLRFVGCAEVLKESDWRPLKVIPLEVTFQ